MCSDGGEGAWRVGRQQGKEQERERIIKLLEEYDFSTIWRQIEWFPPAWESFGSEELIELIKGETK
jgi:hypothetical protein